jgi:hypothetical protein
VIVDEAVLNSGSFAAVAHTATQLPEQALDGLFKPKPLRGSALAEGFCVSPA